MEDSMNPCPRAAAQMAAFDALPAELRAFLSGYPRGLRNLGPVLHMVRRGDAAEDIMHEITCALPVRRAA